LIKILKEERKSKVLKPAGFGCFNDIPVINITRGCSFYCVYCYANVYRGAPPKGTIHLYHNLRELIKSELDSPRRKNPKPLYICFNTSSDCFQPEGEILQTTFDLMKFLLERDIGISFLTKGYIPDEFIHLFSKRKDKVYVQIGLVSLEKSYQEIFEPGAAPPDQRIGNIKRLKDKGLQVEVRLDPIFPNMTDSEEVLSSLFNALFKVGIREVSLSYLMMRPGIFYQMKRELPLEMVNRIAGYFKKQKWSKIALSYKTKLLSRKKRIEGYTKALMIARRYRIEGHICACKNPDIETEVCTLSRKTFFEEFDKYKRKQQLGFFDRREGSSLNTQNSPFL